MKEAASEQQRSTPYGNEIVKLSEHGTYIYSSGNTTNNVIHAMLRPRVYLFFIIYELARAPPSTNHPKSWLTGSRRFIMVDKARCSNTCIIHTQSCMDLGLVLW